jgi:adenine nucleotide transporter 17
MNETTSDPPKPGSVVKNLGLLETVRMILAKDGLSAFWRGIGPALVLVINPVLQYTVFEQLKNFLVTTRTQKLNASGLVTAAAVLTDWDFFVLGALSKLGEMVELFCPLDLTFSVVATSVTYPYM